MATQSKMKIRSKKTANAKARSKAGAHAPLKGDGQRLTQAENAREKAKKRRSPEKKSELGA